MSVTPVLSDAFRPVVDLLYPPRCPLCGEAIADQNGLCAGCWSGLIIPAGPACSACQRPLPAALASDNAECAECLMAPPVHDGIAAGSLYNETSRQLILRFKHGRKIAMSSMLSRLILARLPTTQPGTLFVPVPLHWTRLWQRGFNQSALLARDLAKARSGNLVVDALRRRKRTPTLGGLGKKARARVLAGAITANPARRALISGSDVVLVDDVLTSGSTSTACVKALKRAGAASVRIACVARVLTEVTG